MAIYGKFTQAKIFAGAYDFSGDLNQTEVTYAVEMLDATAFGNNTKINLAGVGTVAMTAAGFANLADDAQDERAFANVSLDNVAITLMPGSAAGAAPGVGDLAYFFQAAQAQYQLGGAHGAILPFSINANGGQSGHDLIRGYVLEPGITNRTATLTGTATSNPGAVSATQFLYAALHVVTAGGTSVDVKIQSDDLVGFASPTDRITFAQVTTTPTGFYATRVAGAITDTFWRVLATIVGAGPYKFACLVGIK